MALLAIVAVIFGALQLRKSTIQMAERVSHALRLDWKVVVVGDGLTPTTAQAIEQWSLRYFNGLWPDFENAASQVRNHFGLESVQLFREGFQKVRIKALPRLAVMRIQTQSGRLLSKDFYVFGKASSETTHLPLLQGAIFHNLDSEQSETDWAAEQLKDKPLRGAQYALELLTLLEGKSVKCGVFTWDEYRGMSVTLANEPVEVLFGLPPYAEKVARFEQLINERSKTSRPLPQRVEMDFEGKAFIKERNDGTGRL